MSHACMVELAQAFQSGKSTPVDAIETCLAVIRNLDAELGVCNDLVTTKELLRQATEAGRRWRADAPRSALDGIPFGVKANIAIKGLPWHGGIDAYRDRIAARDAAVVSVMKAAGMIPVATLNMHEAALGATSDNPTFKRTRNPRDRSTIPGGSSGGSAAAVAAGMLPVTLGTDDLGSVRLPAALCGVVGFKPSYGLIPVAGVMPLSPRFDHVGIHAGSVADIAAVMALFGVTPVKSNRPWRRWLTGAPLADDVSALLAEALARVGVDGELDWSAVDFSRVRRAGLLLCERDAAETHRHMLRVNASGFSREFHTGIEWAGNQDEEAISEAESICDTTSRTLRSEVGQALLVGPTTPCLAPAFGEEPPVIMADLTVPAAIAGVPAISLPVWSSAFHLPAGLQLIGADDASLLHAARDIEHKLEFQGA